MGTKSWKMQKCLYNVSFSVLCQCKLPFSSSEGITQIFDTNSRKTSIYPYKIQVILFTLLLMEWLFLPQFSVALGKNKHTEGSEDSIQLLTKSCFAVDIGVPQMYVVTLNLATYLSRQNTCWGGSGCLSNLSPDVQTSERLDNFIFLMHHCALLCYCI